MLHWTERAVDDLLGIGDRIAADNPSAARSWVEKLRQRAMKASDLPHSVPGFGRSDLREVFLSTHRIVYRVVDDGIVVLSVFEGHRLLGELDPDAD